AYAEGDIQVRQTDAAGNTGEAASLGAVTVDMTAPAAPVITGAEDNVAEGTGNVANGGLTNDATPTLTGTAEAGATVWVYDNDTLVGTAVANDTGSWTLSPTLTEGSHSFTVSVTDAAGNSATSEPYTLTLDLSPPSAPVGVLENDTGVTGDGITSDGTVVISGIETGADWEYSVDGGVTWQAGSGSTLELAEGVYDDGDVLVRQTDAAGNVSETFAFGPITVDDDTDAD